MKVGSVLARNGVLILSVGLSLASGCSTREGTKASHAPAISSEVSDLEKHMAPRAEINLDEILKSAEKAPPPEPAHLIEGDSRHEDVIRMVRDFGWVGTINPKDGREMVGLSFVSGAWQRFRGQDGKEIEESGVLMYFSVPSGTKAEFILEQETGSGEVIVYVKILEGLYEGETGWLHLEDYLWGGKKRVTYINGKKRITS